MEMMRERWKVQGFLLMILQLMERDARAVCPERVQAWGIAVDSKDDALLCGPDLERLQPCAHTALPTLPMDRRVWPHIYQGA